MAKQLGQYIQLMYRKHFGFEQSPFGITPDPQSFFVNAGNAEALSALALEIKRGNALVVVTGEAGVGKTTMVRKFIADLPEHVGCALVVVKTRLTFVDLLRSVLIEFNALTPATDQESLQEQFRNHVKTPSSRGCSVILIFDEAQAMSDEVLRQVSSLRDLDKAISIIFVGHSDLETRLSNVDLCSLKERLTRMQPMTRFKDADVRSYITSRLKCVELEGRALFEPEAVDKIVRWSNGIPRLINAICDNALLSAYRRSASAVTAQMIEQVIIDLQLDDRFPGAPGKSPTENVQLPNLEHAVSMSAPDVGLSVTHTEDQVDIHRTPAMTLERKTHLPQSRFVNLGRFRRAIGAVGIIIGLMSVLIASYSRQRHAAAPTVKANLANSRTALSAVNAALEPMRGENKVLAPQAPQSTPILLPVSTVVGDPGDIQNDSRTKQQTHGEIPDKQSRTAAQEIYRVVGISFVRNKPAANADIIETLRPGIRVAILSRSGDYIRVRSLDNAAILGFVHREDAFFERIR